MSYERPSLFIPHPSISDTRGVFHKPEDRQREEALAEIVKDIFNLSEMLYLGNLAHFDFVAIRNGAPVAIVEFISRNDTYEGLLMMGGPFLKTDTLKAAQFTAEARLSVQFMGVFIFYDLQNGLYYQEARDIVGHSVLMTDNRQAADADTEPGVAIHYLENLIMWKEPANA